MASSMPGSQSITRRVGAMARLYLGPPMNDRSDPAPARDRFALPPEVYLAGNSLGLQPLAARDAIAGRIDEWATLAVEGWWEAGWLDAADDAAGAAGADRRRAGRARWR